MEVEGRLIYKGSVTETHALRNLIFAFACVLRHLVRNPYPFANQGSLRGNAGPCQGSAKHASS